MDPEPVVRYSEAFKLRVISDLESGKCRSIQDAREIYGIRGGSTIQGWLKKYSRNDLMNRMVRVETPEERDQIKALKQRIAELEKVLVETKMDDALHRAYFDILCREKGITDVDAYKKKLAEKRLQGQ